MKLKNLAAVSIEHSFRWSVERAEDGNVPVIQMKDITEDSRLVVGDLTPVWMACINQQHLIHQHDMVFRYRGNANKAALVTGDVGLQPICSQFPAG